LALAESYDTTYRVVLDCYDFLLFKSKRQRFAVDFGVGIREDDLVLSDEIVAMSKFFPLVSLEFRCYGFFPQAHPEVDGILQFRNLDLPDVSELPLVGKWIIHEHSHLLLDELDCG